MLLIKKNDKGTSPISYHESTPREQPRSKRDTQTISKYPKAGPLPFHIIKR